MIYKKKITEIVKKILENRKRSAIAAAILLAAGGLVFWRVSASKQDNKSEIQTVKVEKGMIIDSVSASGQVLSVNVMSANTQASGIVENVFVSDGQTVKKGDKILEIKLDFQGEQKNSQAWSAYLSAKNSLESAKATQYTLRADMLSKWETFKELAESDSYQEDSDNRNLPDFYIPQDNWLSAEIKYKTQEAVIAQTQTAINSAWLSYVQTSPIITAPMDGVITSLMYIPGMSIGSLDTGNSTSNQKVATIKTEGMPIVSVNLSEIDVSKVNLGQKATVTIDSIDGKTFTGKVAGVDRIGQTTSGVTQYPAIIQLDSTADEILPNMTVTANIVIDRKDGVLLIPSSAVQNQGGQNLVLVVKNGQQQSVPVEIGLTSDTQTEIVSGLSEGEMVVNGSMTLTGTQSSGSSPFGGSNFGGMMRIAH